MNRNHISDEVLIACIDKSLSKSEYRKVSNHMKDCDECYLRYSTLLKSISAGETAKPEEVPNEIKQFAKEQLEITDTISPQQSGKISIFNKLKNIGRNIPILRPIPITAVSASVVLLLIIFNISNNNVSKTPFITTSKELSPISVKIENDSLIILQSITVDNSILITSVKGDTLLSSEFSELKTVYPLSEFEGHDKIQILISSQSVNLIDTTLKMR